MLVGLVYHWHPEISQVFYQNCGIQSETEVKFCTCPSVSWLRYACRIFCVVLLVFRKSSHFSCGQACCVGSVMHSWGSSVVLLCLLRSSFLSCGLCAALSNPTFWAGEKGGNRIALILISLLCNVYENNQTQRCFGRWISQAVSTTKYTKIIYNWTIRVHSCYGF